MALSSDLSKPLRGDDSPPRNGVIAVYAVLVVCSLIGLKFIFDSYFLGMIDAERTQKMSAMASQLTAHREDENARLTAARMSVDEAMANLAAQRFEHPSVARQPSDNVAAMEGWNRLPSFVSTRRFPAQQLTPQAPSAPAAVETPPDASQEVR